MMLFLSETSGDIAGMTAVFPILIIVAEVFAAMGTNQTMYTLTLHFIPVRVPPLKPAFIGAERLRLGFRRLFQTIAALFTYIFVIVVPRIIGSIAGIELAAPAERLNGINGKTE